MRPARYFSIIQLSNSREIPENAGRQKYMDGVAGRAWTGMMDEVPLHKDSKLFRPYSGIKTPEYGLFLIRYL